MNKKDNKVAFKHERGYEWLIMPQSYFQGALIAARILNKKLNNIATIQGSTYEIYFKEIYGDYPQSCEYLIFPILFSFKHGIELYLKSIIGITKSEFPKNHDLLDLLKKSGVKDKKLKEIIQKYIYCKLFLLNNNVCDTENQFERYPQGSPYDKEELFPDTKKGVENMISQEKVTELIEDIVYTRDFLRRKSLKVLEKKEKN
jgi:hypothetical protein